MNRYSTTFRHRFCRAAVSVLVAGWFVASLLSHHHLRAADSDASTATDHLSVDELIERLGSPNYATRLRAKELLQRLELEAFDALHKAQYHPDSEIAMSARHLVSSLLVSWSKETDPAAVRDALEEYGAQNEAERGSRMELLSELPDRQGLEALVRLARFETSLRLSRQAALLLMRQPMSETEAKRRRESELVLEVLGDNDRQAAKWLRVYAQDLAAGAYSAEKWRQLIDDQRYQVDTGATQQASRATVLELMRVCAARAALLDQRDEAIALAIKHIDLIPPTTRDLIDACSWAIDNGLHPFVLELRDSHPRIFEQQPVLLYGAAEALSNAGDDSQAQDLANQALAINPLPKNDEERKLRSPKEIEEIAQTHREIGQELRQRGLFRWAEREFQLIIDSLEINSIPASYSRVHLAAMFGELLRHEDVIAVLEPFVERRENDDEFASRLNAIHFDYTTFELRSLLEYHRGLAAIESDNIEAAMPLFKNAYELDPKNIDILISMYHVSGGEDWKKTVGEMLERQTRLCQIEVQQDDASSRQIGRIPSTEIQLSRSLNAYAWLVSNTEGDYARALQYSLRSLEIAPDDWQLIDTCARCYFATGDIENAVRLQRRAVRMMSHFPPLLRQLAEFEEALNSKREL